MAAPTLQVHAKAWTAAFGTVLNAVVTILQQYGGFLPAPWPAVVTGALGLLTVFGVYKVPNKPAPAAVGASPWPVS